MIAATLKFYIVITMGKKLNLVITFDWRVLLTLEQRVWSERYDQIKFLADFPIVIKM